MSKILSRYIEAGIAGKGIVQNGTTYALEVEVTANKGLGFSGSAASDTLEVLVDGTSVTFNGNGELQVDTSGVTANIAGAGLVANGNAIDIVAADDSITVNADSIQVKLDAAGAISVDAGDGLQVNVDDSTIEVNANALRVKPNSITATHIDETGSFTWTGAHSFTGGSIDVPTPSSANHAANKSYVDSIAAYGVDWKLSVRAATTANLAADYNNGTGGVGATLTGSDVGALPSFDGVSLVVGNRVLVKNQTNSWENGIYQVTDLGDEENPFILTRTTDADNSPSGEVSPNMAVMVEEGTVNADSGWTMTVNGTVIIGTTSLFFTQFTGLGQITAGAGLTKTGNTLDVGAGNGITVNANDVSLASTVAGDGLTYTTGVLAVGAGDGITVSADSVSLASTVAGAGLTYTTGVLAVGAGDGITVNADTVALASTTAGDGLTYTSGVLAVGAGNGISVTADAVAVDATASFTWTGTHDFTGGTVTVLTQTATDSDTSVASTAFVHAAIQNDVGLHNVQYITLNSTNISNGYVDLAQTPHTAAHVLVDIIGAGAQEYGVDFTVITDGSSVKRLKWTTGGGGPTTGLSGVLVDGSKLRVVYTY